jgi:hypothetical protein
MSFSKIIFEYPLGWLDTNSDPLASQHIRCFELLRSAARNLGIVFETRTSLRLADFAQRFAPNDTLLISVHTVGISNNVVRLKESYIPGYYYFDRTGYSGWAELAYNERLQQEATVYNPFNLSGFISKLREKKIRDNLSKYPQDTGSMEIELIKSAPYIFLALQTSDDLVARLAAVDQIKFAELLAARINDLKYRLIIKRHPLCRDHNIESAINKLKNDYKCVMLSNDSVNSLIQQAEAVVTVNSGVGFEALVMGRPVITAGLSDYSFVTKQVINMSDIDQLHTGIRYFDATKADRFVGYYLNEYCLNIEQIESAERLINKWMSDDYSSMRDLTECGNSVLEDTQKYMAELEGLRRRMIYENVNGKGKTRQRTALEALSRAYRRSLAVFKSQKGHV